MNLSAPLLLTLTSIISLSFISVDLDPPVSLKSIIDETNEKIGTDSVYLSALSEQFQPDEYLISDHLVLINDISSMTDLLSKDITFTIAYDGHLELVDFDLKELEARIVNTGSMTLTDCLFQEGKDLTQYISNQGAFSIANGLFQGSKEGDIIRDAVFSHGARLIL